MHNSCCRSRRTGFTRASPSDPFPVRMTRATHGPRHAPAPRTRLSLAAARWRRVPDSRVRDGSNGDPLARPGCAGPAPGGGHRGEPEDPRVRRATRAAGRSRPQARAGPGAAGGRGGAGPSDMAARGVAPGYEGRALVPVRPPPGTGRRRSGATTGPCPARRSGSWASGAHRASARPTCPPRGPIRHDGRWPTRSRRSGSAGRPTGSPRKTSASIAARDGPGPGCIAAR